MAKNEAEIMSIVLDLGEFDNEHLLLEPYELAAVRIVKVAGQLSYYILNPNVEDIEESDRSESVILNYSAIRPYVVQLFIDAVLVHSHVGAKSISDFPSNVKIPEFEDKLGLEMTSMIMRTVGALIEGLHSENAILFGASIKLLKSYLYNILMLYKVPVLEFYDQVEEYVYEELLRHDVYDGEKTSMTLKMEFKGKESVTINALIDKRRKRPFSGFSVVIDEGGPVKFVNFSPVHAFLEVTQYINDKTEYRDVKIRMGSKTKSLINKYNIMFAKGDILQKEMDKGFYPVLVPKGVADMNGFLDALTKPVD